MSDSNAPQPLIRSYNPSDDDKNGYRMIVMIITDGTFKGGIEVRTLLIYATFEGAQNCVNKLLSEEKRNVVGWKITHVLPIK